MTKRGPNDYNFWDWLFLAFLWFCILVMPISSLYAYLIYDPTPVHKIAVPCYAIIDTRTGVQEQLEPACRGLMTPAMIKTAEAIAACIRKEDDPYSISPNALAAFSSLASTTKQGIDVICNPEVSTLATFLDRRYPVWLACKQIMRWDYIEILGSYWRWPGLTLRREWEYDLCVKAWEIKW